MTANGFTSEAVTRLSHHPELRERLAHFVDLWGLDGYDPFGPSGCAEAVRQIVAAVLADTARAAEEAGP